MSTALISIGARALLANYAALQTTGNNIANANTPGYSRQSVELTTATSQFSGGGFFGKGVDVATVSRAHSDLLTRELHVATAVAAGDADSQLLFSVEQTRYRNRSDGGRNETAK